MWSCGNLHFQDHVTALIHLAWGKAEAGLTPWDVKTSMPWSCSHTTFVIHLVRVLDHSVFTSNHVHVVQDQATDIARQETLVWGTQSNTSESVERCDICHGTVCGRRI